MSATAQFLERIAMERDWLREARRQDLARPCKQADAVYRSRVCRLSVRLGLGAGRTTRSPSQAETLKQAALAEAAAIGIVSELRPLLDALMEKHKRFASLQDSLERGHTLDAEAAIVTGYAAAFKAIEEFLLAIEGPDRPVAKSYKRKRSTSNGDPRALIISGLTSHHEYADGQCLNFEPVVLNELTRKIKVGSGTVSQFFKERFGSYAKYVAACHDDPDQITTRLRKFNGEFTDAELS